MARHILLIGNVKMMFPKTVLFSAIIKGAD